MPSSTATRPRESVAAKPRRKSGSRKGSSRFRWTYFWPILAGILITVFTVRFASILALEGPKPFALLYPWVVVLRSPALHIPADLAGSLSQAMLFIQFPLYGLLMTLTLRADKHLRAFIIGLAAHFTGLIAVVALAWFAA